MLQYKPRLTSLPDMPSIEGVSDHLRTLLAIRGIVNEDEVQRFLQPDISQLHDPFLFPDMKQAVQRIFQAAQRREKVLIYGDYDVDGVTSTSLLMMVLGGMGIDVDYYIPDRHQEGYGLHEETLERLSEKNFQLLITVDCGITALDEIELCHELGMDTIVTDHHQPLDVLPQGIVICPKVGGYPFLELAGVGVAAKLVQALGGVEMLMPYMDIVATGTVADIVPLVDENRVFVQYGLKQINSQPQRTGIKSLLDIAGLAGKPVTAGNISFGIAPRINAGGRIGHSARSVELFTTADEALAMEIALKLNEQNVERQRQESVIMAEALAQVEKQYDPRRDRMIIAVGEEWNPGVIGIVASRLVERFQCPTILLAKDGEAYVGSGRSIKGVHLFQALDSMSDLFLRYGGHSMAAGLSIAPQGIAMFRQRMQAYLENLPETLWIPVQEYDLSLSLNEVNDGLLRDIERLQPTGMGNPSPVYLLQDVQACQARTLGAQSQHLRMLLKQNSDQMEGVAFRMGERLSEAEGELDILAQPEWNNWMGNSTIRLMIRSMRPGRGKGLRQLKKNAEVLFCQSLESAFSIGAKPSFKRYISLPNEETAQSMVRRLLEDTTHGLLIACAVPETLQRWHAWLAQEGLLEKIQIQVGRIDKCSGDFNTLCCPAVADDPAYARFSQILLADGVWENAWAAQLADTAPNAAIYAAPMSRETVQRANAALLDVEQMRDVYRAVVQRKAALTAADSFGSFYMLLGLTDISQSAVFATLCAMRDVGLIRMECSPFVFDLMPKDGRKDIEDSTSRCMLKRIAQK